MDIGHYSEDRILYRADVRNRARGDEVNSPALDGALQEAGLKPLRSRRGVREAVSPQQVTMR